MRSITGRARSRFTFLLPDLCMVRSPPTATRSRDHAVDSRGPMALRALERLAALGMVAGVGLVALDALRHPGRRFWRFVPNPRLVHDHWAFVAGLVRLRPALVWGLVLLCLGLLLALAVVSTELVRAIRARRRSGAGDGGG